MKNANANVSTAAVLAMALMVSGCVTRSERVVVVDHGPAVTQTTTTVVDHDPTPATTSTTTTEVTTQTHDSDHVVSARTSNGGIIGGIFGVIGAIIAFPFRVIGALFGG